MSAQVNSDPVAAAADATAAKIISPSVGPLDPNQGNISPLLQPTVPETSTAQKRGGSLTPGGSMSKSELSSMTGSIASKLDQYLGSTNNSLHRHNRGSSDSNVSLGSLSGANLENHNHTSDNNKDSNNTGGEQNSSGSVYASGSGGSNNGELDDDTKLANNLAAISLATQKISEIYLEPKPKKSAPDGHQVTNDHFEPEKHFYPRVLNAQIHPMVGYFFSLGNERIIARYMHLNPQVNEEVLRKCLDYVPKHFQWAGSDLFNVTTASGHRQMIIVETNSCPSGQKSMPLLSESDEHGGYRLVLESAFKDMIETADRSLGGLAVVCDKNMMEASGYASTLAEVMKEKVWLVEFYEYDQDPPVKWVDRVMYIRDEKKEWHSIRACFRYVTQKPWNRFPLYTKTIVMNQTVACLAGGRNKMMAARAYEFFNAELADSGLHVRVPETINNVTKNEIPLWLDSMGGHAVVKVPYSNAGQGVYTITNKQELQEFMDTPQHYDKYIVQSLVGNASWSSMTRHGKFYHVGTIPNKKNNTFVTDLRMMVAGNKQGFRPICIYARRARKPLIRHLEDDLSTTSWEMLGTNLSVKSPTGEWSTEAARLLLMDRKDFNQLGLGVDDMIDAYIQTVLSVIAIDKMCQRLMKDNAEGPGQTFDMELFKALNPDSVLWQEVLL
ncbi:hypothetical protein EC957_003302 [Mortierella hygrophila]|uniref:Uncharacterized protein n=1 Tax=Mortierella hygrophila TaxID=979708 RepID=A0A9P6K148_9FUNG|nr:hypothetical protein EC957_003302 [Mortierella hygrophila]